MIDELIPSNQERICPECGRKFTPTIQWAYKISTKGTYIYLCRYNCHRAAEKRLEDKTRGKKEMKSKKPTKEQLEKDLRAGLSLAQIAKKHNSCDASAYNWIKAYGLQGIKGEVKPTAPTPTVETPPAGRSAPTMTSGVAVVHGEVIAQPTLAEIEQFHTDIEVQELPRVEMESVLTIDDELLDLIMATVEVQPVDPFGMTEEENMSDAEWEARKPVEPTWTQDEWESKHKEKWEGETQPVVPALPAGPFAEVWQGALEDIQSIRRVQIKMAEDEFKAQFLKFARAVLGEEAIRLASKKGMPNRSTHNHISKARQPCKCLTCAKASREVHEGKTMLICKDEACDMRCGECTERPVWCCGYKSVREAQVGCL